jgi:hypothetical protein
VCAAKEVEIAVADVFRDLAYPTMMHMSRDLQRLAWRGRIAR